jgi:hypothetical protein
MKVKKLEIRPCCKQGQEKRKFLRRLCVGRTRVLAAKPARLIF